MTRRQSLNELKRSEASRLMRDTALFAGLSDEHFVTLLDNTRTTSLEDGQTLFKQRSPVKEAFLLADGHVKLSRISPDGQEKIIDLVTPGNTFAEALLFSNQSVYPVTATALTPSEVLCFSMETYANILHKSTDACFSVMAQMSRRLHWQISEIDRLTLHNASFRVIAFILDQVPSTDHGCSQIQLNAPKHVIASRLSITPETLSRTFSKLVKDGLISISENTITLNDVGQLRNYARMDHL